MKTNNVFESLREMMNRLRTTALVSFVALPGNMLYKASDILINISQVYNKFMVIST